MATPQKRDFGLESAHHRAAELVLLPEATHAFGGKHPYPDTALPAPAKQVADHSIAFLRNVFGRG
jgi:hypothetical protein